MITEAGRRAQSLLVFFQFPFSTPGDWFENHEDRLVDLRSETKRPMQSP
jgi:hypothetical protein